MDIQSAMSQQWKDRDSKVYSQKAEVKAKEKKELTGTPKIDPLSRKIAEIVTQQELAELGIVSKEPAPKKPTFSIPKSTPSRESPQKPYPQSNNPNLSKQSPKKQRESPMKPLDKQIDEPEPNPGPIILDPSKPENQQISNPLQNHNEIPHLIVTKDSEPVKDNINKSEHEEMLNNVEHLQAFQEELQREYPELGLNNSVEGSSFRTDELDALEEACKDLDSQHKRAENPMNTAENPMNTAENPMNTTEKKEETTTGNAEKKEESKEGNKDEEKKEHDMLSNNTDYGNSPDNVGIVTKSQVEKKKTGSEKSQADKEKSLKNEKNGKKDFVGKNNREPNRSKTEGNSPSKRQNRPSSKEGVADEFKNLQTASAKAQFLHLHEEKILKNTPRCHINLTNCRTSPIYFSIRVPFDSKVKVESGIGSAGSLRRILLRQFLDEGQDSKDFYTKNLEWLQNRDGKIQEIRDRDKDKDLEECTFDPYFEKHENFRRNTYNFEYKATVSPLIQNSEKSLGPYNPKISENIIKYQALSPTDYFVKYPEGANLDRMMEVGKPMVSYRSINLLR
ncbi:hypothetical protein SteCoe_8699 [Stentor coeruleus]|uniref:Uncharacterized protein n=1 Tax=Stentor coeruleus TaxID=5963 RepID=A0A1R2CJT3_9CILI|nr:hypothetical protein SteCoe_8699 [Stentor coeruleus]